MPNAVNIAGKKFGRLTAISRSDNSANKRTQWLFRCDCGKEIVAQTHRVTTGHTSSCGCLAHESRIINGKKSDGGKCRTHGMSRHPLDAVYDAMKGRCNNPKNKDYKNYGARGIAVCSEWERSPKIFFEWAINSGYKKGLSLDRIDNNKGYSPENCRFVSQKEQANNKQKTVMIVAGGVRKPLSAWANDMGVSASTIYYRIFKHGWTPEEAVGIDNPPRLSAKRA